MPDVLCWKTGVHDEIARELCGHFYACLMRQSKDGIVQRNYRLAFDAATDAMRPHAYTRGAAHPPGGRDMAYVKEGRMRDLNVEYEQEEEAGTTGAAVATREQTDNARTTRAKAMPWHLEWLLGVCAPALQ